MYVIMFERGLAKKIRSSIVVHFNGLTFVDFIVFEGDMIFKYLVLLLQFNFV